MLSFSGIEVLGAGTPADVGDWVTARVSYEADPPGFDPGSTIASYPATIRLLTPRNTLVPVGPALSAHKTPSIQ